jgi:hypothetical protein
LFLMNNALLIYVIATHLKFPSQDLAARLGDLFLMIFPELSKL